MTFSQPFGLATDSQGYLYVADYGHARVVVFDPSGNYWSTLNSSSGMQAIGVCVSSQGVVGVTNFHTSFTPGKVDFFTNKGAQNSMSSPSGSAFGGLLFSYYCAFDRRGDFIASGNTNPFGNTDIAYVRNNNVNVPNETLQSCANPLCHNGQVWLGMYSHIRPGTVNTVSVADGTVPNIVNFRVNLGSPNHLIFVPWSSRPITALANYPLAGGADDIHQVAPTTGQGNPSELYLADYYAGTIERVSNVKTGGTANLFNSLDSVHGIATNPTGQY